MKKKSILMIKVTTPQKKNIQRKFYEFVKVRNIKHNNPVV